MPLRDLKFSLEKDSPETLVLQLVRLLAREILDGRLAPGTPLPGSRPLANELGVPRHVVMTALRQLELEGWVASRDRSGTSVAEKILAVPQTWIPLPPPIGIPEDPPFDLPSQSRPFSSLATQGIDLSEGLPDARLAPQAALAMGYRRAVLRHGDDLLAKGEARGNQHLREHLARYLINHRSLKAKPENLLLARSTPMTITLVASTLFPKGGNIAVETPGNPVAWEALRAVPGVQLHSVPVDEGGMNVDALAALVLRQRVDMLYLTPRFQIPTTVTLTLDRRLQLLDLARRHRFCILEEDPDLEYDESPEPFLPLAASDEEGRVIHLGSLSHLLAPGVGISFLVAPKALVDRMARVRQRMDIQGDRVLEWAVADLIRDGDFQRHLTRARPLYASRRSSFIELIQQELGSGFELRPPSGGLACWLRAPKHLDLEAWALACRNEGVKFHPGSHYEFQKAPLPFVRLGFGSLEHHEARQALQCMRTCLGTLLPRPHD